MKKAQAANFMAKKKSIFIIVGSANRNSANQRLVYKIAAEIGERFNLVIYEDLKKLPHFEPERSIENTPHEVLAFRNAINDADGVLICTPEYIFSIPAGLKNAIEWCVSTTVFSQKPLGIITASAHGLKGHEELQMIMKTVMATFTNETTLLIQGVKGKINEQGEITDTTAQYDLSKFITSFEALLIQRHAYSVEWHLNRHRNL